MASGNPARKHRTTAQASATPSASVSAPRWNRFAIVSVVAGIVGFFTPFGIAGAFAIVLAEIGRRQVRRSGERGRGLAIAGLVLGIITLVAGIVLIFWAPFGR